MDVILHTSKIRWTYPKDRQQPKAFQVHGDEFTINVIEPTDAVVAPVVYVA